MMSHVMTKAVLLSKSALFLQLVLCGYEGGAVATTAYNNNHPGAQ